MRFRPRSLRSKAVLVIVGVLTLPQLLVFLSTLSEGNVGERMRERTATAAREAAATVERQLGAADAAAEAIDAIATEYGVRIRLFDQAGTVLVDHDRETSSGLTLALSNFFFGPDGAPSLSDFDATRDALQLRPEVTAALLGGTTTDCQHSSGRKLLVCHTVVRAESEAGPVLVYVQESSRRAIRALYDLRYQLLKLTLFVLPMGVLIALWLGWRLARPAERLRHDVLERARAAVPSADISLDREDEFGDLARAFNSLLGALAERGRQNEAFLADLAHELKNPIAAVRSAAESLESSGGTDQERAQRLSGMMLRSCSRLDQLVSEFLELARAEAGLPDETRETLDVRALVDGVVQSAHDDERYGDVRIEVTGAERLPVRVATRRMEMVVRNLLDNAVSFAGDGGWVRIELEEREDGAVLRVIDSGPGIAAEELPLVFDRFYTTRGERLGTGLGLALVRAIVEAHGGRVVAESPEGSGAQIVVHLPR